MDPTIVDVLSWYGLEGHEQRLQANGVFVLSDMRYIGEKDLRDFGMNVVEARKLLEAVWYCWHDEWAAPPVTAVDETIDIHEWAQEKEKEALYLLDIANRLAFLSCAELAYESGQHALERLGKQQDFARNAMLAFTATWRARVSCKGVPRKSFDKAVRAVRDVTVIRVQLAVPWGNRDAFIEELERVSGGPIPLGLFAAFMHAHTKTVCEKYPSAFLSNCKIRRRAPRPPRKTLQAANANEVDPEGEEEEQVINEVDPISLIPSEMIWL